MARPRIIAAARILVVINGNLYGRCGSISWNVANPKKSIRSVDSPFVQEYAPTTLEVTGSMTIYRLINDGGLEGAGISAPMIDQSREKYVTIQLIERETDTTLLQINQAAIQGQSWNAVAKGLLMGQFSFTGIIFTNEADV